MQTVVSSQIYILIGIEIKQNLEEQVGARARARPPLPGNPAERPAGSE